MLDVTADETMVSSQDLFCMDGYEIVGISDNGGIVSLSTDSTTEQAWSALDSRMREAGWEAAGDGSISQSDPSTGALEGTAARSYSRRNDTSKRFALVSIMDMGDTRVILIQTW